MKYGFTSSHFCDILGTILLLVNNGSLSQASRRKSHGVSLHQFTVIIIIDCDTLKSSQLFQKLLCYKLLRTSKNWFPDLVLFKAAGSESKTEYTYSREKMCQGLNVWNYSKQHSSLNRRTLALSVVIHAILETYM